MKLILVFLAALLAIAPTTLAQDDTTPARGNRLFADDFTTYANRWDQLLSAKYRSGYADFAYRFTIKSPGVAVWSTPETDLDLDRYVVDVDVQSTTDGAFGLVLNYRDDDNFYIFEVTTDGSYAFRLRRKDQATTLAAGDVVPAAYYHLMVHSNYGQFEISINGETLATFVDDTLGGGTFGLYARAGREVCQVTFDNYLVHDVG